MTDYISAILRREFWRGFVLGTVAGINIATVGWVLFG